ncbi:MAG: DUF3829 domain-containing protein [Enterocloster asparagiformis]|nr:DUF3829 domain-containing protein [Enterocloster asparagiformis]
MRKKRMTMMAAAALAASLAVAGCGAKTPEAGGKFGEEKGLTLAQETETEETEPELDEETMDLIKYNIYIELSNDILEILDNIDYYFTVVDSQEEFALLPDTGLTYGYRIVGANTDTLEMALELADMEPSYGEMDNLVKEMADPLRKLMESFSEISRMHGAYADNQYAKPKELHPVILAAAMEFEPAATDYYNAMTELESGRAEQFREELKSEGYMIQYYASNNIDLTRKIIDAVEKQDVTDENINDMDLTEIRTLYDELAASVEQFNEAAADNDQLIVESLSNSRPFDGLFEKQLQAVEWMIKQVESGKPIEDVSLEPLGSISHVINTLNQCIDRYNSVFAE